MRIALTLVATLSLLTAIPALAQTRSLAQDPALDNLRHPAGTEVAAFGTLGRVRKSGEGRRVMLLIPGIGFGDGVWSEFMERHKADYTMYAVTLPGFDGTAPLPMPPEGSKYADGPATGILRGEHRGSGGSSGSGGSGRNAGRSA